VGLHWNDPKVGIEWPTTGTDGKPLAPALSEKDEVLPTLEELVSSGRLPRHETV